MNVRLRLFVYISAQKQRIDMITTQTQSFLGCIIFTIKKVIHSIICDTKNLDVNLITDESICLTLLRRLVTQYV